MTEDTNNDISQEDIDRIKEDIIKSFSDVNINDPEQLMKYLQSNYIGDLPNIDRPKKLISCPHEIVFNLRASVMEENEKGEIVSCKEVCQKDYHIPVPPKKDYTTYMECFFKYLENCITNSAKNTNESIEDKNE